MSDERKPVVCPWCGKEMTHRAYSCIGTPKGTAKYRLYCDCGGGAPYGTPSNNEEDGRKAAYVAATRRPENRPLTREQVEALPKDTPVWLYTHRGYPYALRTAQNSYHLADAYFIFECAKPTPEDIEAARKERCK